MANFTPIGVEIVTEGLAEFGRDMHRMTSGLDDVQGEINDLANRIDDALNPILAEMRSQTQLLTRQMALLEKPVDDVGDESAEASDKVDRFSESQRKAKKTGKDWKESLKSTINTVANVTTAVIQVTRAAIDFGQKIAGAVASTVESAISVESAFAGVIKTTDGLVDSSGDLTEAGAEIKQEFRDLAKEVPLAVEELMAVGEIGGQLGIAREDLLGFTETIVAMGEATNLTREEAATQFAQIANIMGTVEEEGDQAFSKLGSTIVALGNNFATTERDISAFAQRIAGAGEIAGLTEADVFAIGAAMSSVGVQAEAGGTAVQKVLLSMNQAVLEGGDALDIFAATAGMTTKDFAEFYEKDAGVAFENFVLGLGNAGDDALMILDALELKDQRLTRAFLSLANAGGVLTDSITLSREAWEENDALTKEANQRYATMESQIAMVKNRVRDMGITIGEALLPFLTRALEVVGPFISDFAERLPQLLQGSVIPAIEGFLSAAEPFLKWLLETVLFGDPLNDWLTHMPEAFQPFIRAIAEVIVWLQEKMPLAIAFVSGAFQKLSEETGGIQGIIQFFASEVLPFLVEQWNKVTAWFVENGPLIIETGQAILNFWQKRIVPALDNVFNIIKLAFGGMVDAILRSAKIFMLILTGDWDKAWKEIITQYATIGLNLLAIWDEFLEGVLNAFGTSSAEFLAMWRNNWEMAKTIVVTVWNNIKESFSQFVEDTKEAGKAIIEGFVDGVKDNAKKLVDAVKRAINDAISAARRLLGIESPSKVFFSIGTDLSKGLAMGIDAMRPAVVGATAGTVASATATASAPSSAVTNINSFSFETTIASDMDAAVFQADTLRTVEAGLAAGL